MRAEAWLFDYYAQGNLMVLWFLLEDGARLRLVERFEPLAFIEGGDREVAACVRALEKAGEATGEGWTERTDFWSGRGRRVYALRLRRVGEWRRALDQFADRFPGLCWHQADLPPEQCWGFERETFPLMHCRIEFEDGLLLALESLDDRWDTGYHLPPLRTVSLSAKGCLEGARPRLESLTMVEDDRVVTWDDPRELLSGFQRALNEGDPDVLLTDRGDSFLMPLLFSAAREQRFPLRLDRDRPPDRAITTEGCSYMSYGKVLYQAPEYSLRGRWHLDRSNSFALSQDGMNGLHEVARLSRIPIQRIARRSIGTGISSIQLDRAWRQGILIPWKKTHPEAWKTARQLLKADRGGLVYAPETGLHEHVVELDFVAMYPNIMSRFNVSPETVNCDCCSNRVVPEIGYTICEKRRGLVSEALAPIIAKRVRYKALRREAKATGDAEAYTRWDQRQDAIKWMLVSCFGYLGYRNARFGRIEAHEAVSAYSRDVLLTAREVCEAAGWRMLHANVDCVWIVKPGFQEEEVSALCEAITAATRLPIALEGIYRWLAFLPSRQVEDRPVPTRYFGAFRDGSIKYRGIECRRRDLPRYIRGAQLELLKVLAATAVDAGSYRAAAQQLLPRIAEMEGALLRHEIPLEDLLIHQSLSRDPEEYRGNSAQALAARQAVQASLPLHAGEKLSYLITSGGDADRTRRVRLQSLLEPDSCADPIAMIRLLRRAMNALLWPAGITLDERHLAPPPAPRRKQRAPQPDLFDAC